eukprot:1718308-Lingulodinium_polyedra.AAC.1
MILPANRSVAVVDGALGAVVCPGSTLYIARRTVPSREAFLSRIFNEQKVIAFNTKHKWAK